MIWVIKRSHLPPFKNACLKCLDNFFPGSVILRYDHYFWFQALSMTLSNREQLENVSAKIWIFSSRKNWAIRGGNMATFPFELAKCYCWTGNWFWTLQLRKNVQSPCCDWDVLITVAFCWLRVLTWLSFHHVATRDFESLVVDCLSSLDFFRLFPKQNEIITIDSQSHKQKARLP